MILEYKIKEWLETIRDSLYKNESFSYDVSLEELNAYKALCEHFKCLLEENYHLISVSSETSLFRGGKQPEWYNVANWKNLDQKFKNQVLVNYFISDCHPYAKKSLNLLPDDIKNYILAHSL